MGKGKVVYVCVSCWYYFITKVIQTLKQINTKAKERIFRTGIFFRYVPIFVRSCWLPLTGGAKVQKHRRKTRVTRKVCMILSIKFKIMENAKQSPPFFLVYSIDFFFEVIVTLLTANWVGLFCFKNRCFPGYTWYSSYLRFNYRFKNGWQHTLIIYPYEILHKHPSRQSKIVQYRYHK